VLYPPYLTLFLKTHKRNSISTGGIVVSALLLRLSAITALKLKSEKLELACTVTTTIRNDKIVDKI